LAVADVGEPQFETAHGNDDGVRTAQLGSILLKGLGAASFYFDNQSNMLDQFLVNETMVTDDVRSKIDPATVQILKPASHGQSRRLPKVDPIRRNGQAGQS
jgi:hypothetical protein